MRRSALTTTAVAILATAALLTTACSDRANVLPEKPRPITTEGGAAGGAVAVVPLPQPAESEVPAAEAETETASVDPLVAKGKSVYGSVCIACHNMDPNQDGAIGPGLAGTTLELLQTKVLKNEYPAGYTPKRDTLNMVPLPHLEPDLPALAAYLDSVSGT